MKFLEIIIPQYKEKDDIVEKLLISLDKQKNIDFNEIETTIINDGSDVFLTDSMLNKYKKLNINYIKNDENIGAGPIRQKAIDLTKSKYITFIDADDEIADERTLELVISCLKDTNKDLLITNVLVEKILDNKKVLLNKYYGPSDATLHGKFIKREYLEKNNVRFSNELKNNFEDSYFCMAFVGADATNIDMIHLNFPSYIWKLNFSSITRKTKKDYFVETYDEFVKCSKLVIDFLKEKNSILMPPYIIDSIMYDYVMLKSKLFKDINIDNYIKDLKKLYKDNKDIIEKVEDKKGIYNRALERLISYRDKDSVGNVPSYYSFIKEIDQD